MTKRYAFRKHQWELIKDLLPGGTGANELTTKDNRLFVEAVLLRSHGAHLVQIFRGETQ